MMLRTRVQTVAAAALLAVVAVGLSGGVADAKPRRPADNGVRCSLPGSAAGREEDFVFYLPGETEVITGPDGSSAIMRCGADGNWHPLRVVPLPNLQPFAPLSGGVVARP